MEGLTFGYLWYLLKCFCLVVSDVFSVVFCSTILPIVGSKYNLVFSSPFWGVMAKFAVFSHKEVELSGIRCSLKVHGHGSFAVFSSQVIEIRRNLILD